MALICVGESIYTVHRELWQFHEKPDDTHISHESEKRKKTETTNKAYELQTMHDA